MFTGNQINGPILFNPLKHHLGFIKEYVNNRIDEPASDIKGLVRELKHLGVSVMDVYTGSLSVRNIGSEIEAFLALNSLHDKEAFRNWTGENKDSVRIISISDGSEWTIKYHDNRLRFVHIFPARNSRHTFRVKSNTLKSAVIYHILIGKDLVTGYDLNKVRPLLGLSPVKDNVDNEAIREMIEILRE